MTTLTSREILDATVQMGLSKAGQSPGARCANTFLAGAYIALGGFLAIRVGLALPWETFGSLGKFVYGAVFPIGLMLVILCGADLFTGNCMTLTTARVRSGLTVKDSFVTGLSSWVGNFAGALFVAYFMAYATGLIFESVQGSMPWAEAAVKLANGKSSLSFGEAFLRAVGCNWLVCLAVYAAAASREAVGKIVALWFPTMAFVALGFEHCVANMFFIPLGILTGSDPRYAALAEAGKAAALTADWTSFFVNNLLPVTLGNIAGGAVLVGMLYLLANPAAKK
jgi:formate/nitrite transporter